MNDLFTHLSLASYSRVVFATKNAKCCSQSVPELYQLTKAELNCLWENNKDVMLVLVLAEIFNAK